MKNEKLKIVDNMKRSSYMYYCMYVVKLCICLLLFDTYYKSPLKTNATIDLSDER